MKKISRTYSMAVVLIVYVAAFFAGMLMFRLLIAAPVWRYLCADAVATVIVWAFGLLFRNSSMYDPYWSVAPLVLFLCFFANSRSFDAADVIYICIFTFWGVRLTLNWAIGWKGLQQEDWRYTMMRKQNKALWPIANFFGINMMPTLIVFINTLPAFYCSLSLDKLNIITALGALVCIAATVLQIISDSQMRRFRLNPANKGLNIESGLWRYSRHPNYLGEVSFWWGVYIIMLGQRPTFWIAVIAPVLMTLLFVFISAPMMEKRLLQTRPGYDAYKRATSMLLLWPPKKVSHVEDSINNMPS